MPTSAPCKTKRDSTRLQTHTAKTNGITADAIRMDARKARCPNRERAGNTMAKTVNSASKPPMQARTQCMCAEFTLARHPSTMPLSCPCQMGFPVRDARPDLIFCLFAFCGPREVVCGPGFATPASCWTLTRCARLPSRAGDVGLRGSDYDVDAWSRDM